MDHVDRDCDRWIESEGSLSLEDREYGPWIRASPYVMSRKSVIKVPGYFKARKKQTDKRATTATRSETSETSMEETPANHEMEREAMNIGDGVNAMRNGKNPERKVVMESEFVGNIIMSGSYTNPTARQPKITKNE